MVALVVITDGRRDCLKRSVASMREQIRPWPERRFIVDDSGDEGYGLMLDETFPDFDVAHHGERRGFCGTVRSAWEVGLASGAHFIFHAEDDFTYSEPVDLEGLAVILDVNPHLAQIALKRQPVNQDERNAGDFMAAWPPETWTQRDGFIEHKLTFTTNPSLIPRRVIEPLLSTDIDFAETIITGQLLARGYKLGYLGEVADPPRVQHIGDQRTAGWQQ
jgi:hypothetical protein